LVWFGLVWFGLVWFGLVWFLALSQLLWRLGVACLLQLRSDFKTSHLFACTTFSTSPEVELVSTHIFVFRVCVV
jgi:hypothetical protein